jgi:hypothetical protein
MDNHGPINRSTIQVHKMQYIWQILVPFFIMAAIIIAGAIMVVSGGEQGTGVWSDISVIWLITPALFFALAILAVLTTAIYGMVKILQILPYYTGKTQGYFAIFSAGTKKIANGVSKPVIWIRQAGAVIKSFVKR